MDSNTPQKTNYCHRWADRLNKKHIVTCTLKSDYFSKISLVVSYFIIVNSEQLISIRVMEYCKYLLLLTQHTYNFILIQHVISFSVINYYFQIFKLLIKSLVLIPCIHNFCFFRTTVNTTLMSFCSKINSAECEKIWHLSWKMSYIGNLSTYI